VTVQIVQVIADLGLEVDLVDVAIVYRVAVGVMKQVVDAGIVVGVVGSLAP